MSCSNIDYIAGAIGTTRRHVGDIVLKYKNGVKTHKSEQHFLRPLTV